MANAAPNHRYQQSNRRLPPANRTSEEEVVEERTALLSDYLNSPDVQRQLDQVCSEAVTADELVRLMLLAASRQPDLLSCTQHSILRALMDAAQLGIKPMGIQGRGYLVPRMNNKKKPPELEACFDPGWRGLMDVARRGGLVKSISAKVVWEGDPFEYYETETGPYLRHKPVFVLPEYDDKDQLVVGTVIAAWARAILPDGTPEIEVLNRTDIDRIANVSTAKSGPWFDWFDQMCRKSSVRRLCKYLPYSPDLDKAIRVSDRADGFGGPEPAMSRVSSGVSVSVPQTLEEKVAAARAGANPPALGSPTQDAASQLRNGGGAERQAVPVGNAAPTATNQAPRVPQQNAQSQQTTQPQRSGQAKPVGGPAAGRAPDAGRTQEKEPPFGGPVCVHCHKPIVGVAKATIGPNGEKGLRHDACTPFGARGETDGEPPADWQPADNAGDAWEPQQGQSGRSDGRSGR